MNKDNDPDRCRGKMLEARPFAPPGTPYLFCHNEAILGHTLGRRSMGRDSMMLFK